jgi:hypothetical protein
MTNSTSDKSDSADSREMEAAYRTMAADADHEREALEWSEALISDGIDTGHASDKLQKKTLSTQELFSKLDELNSEPFPTDRNQPEAPKRDDFE